MGAGGQLTGYAGGLWRKQALLKLEGHAFAPHAPSLFAE
jgi:methylated-DNA-[protein]-cysteine S-methyltransferase